MACPCTSGAETRTEFLNGLAPLSFLQILSLFIPPPLHHKHTPTPAHTLLLLQANSYHHPTCHTIKCLCLCFQGTVGYHRVLAGTSHLLVTSCSPECLSENTPGIYFLETLFQPPSPTPLYTFPPLTNSLSIPLKTACSKILKVSEVCLGVILPVTPTISPFLVSP